MFRTERRFKGRGKKSHEILQRGLVTTALGGSVTKVATFLKKIFVDEISRHIVFVIVIAFFIVIVIAFFIVIVILLIILILSSRLIRKKIGGL